PPLFASAKATRVQAQPRFSRDDDTAHARRLVPRSRRRWHMMVLNSGDAQGTFLATLQKLDAGGTTYSIDDEATAYLNGTWADLNAGDTADVSNRFRCAAGDSTRVTRGARGPVSAGVEVPLS